MENGKWRKKKNIKGSSTIGVSHEPQRLAPKIPKFPFFFVFPMAYLLRLERFLDQFWKVVILYQKLNFINFW